MATDNRKPGRKPGHKPAKPNGKKPGAGAEAGTPPPAQATRSRWRVLGWIVTALIWLTLGLIALLIWFAYDLPDVADVAATTRKPGVTLLAADGSELATFGDLYGTAVAVADLPPYLPRAVLAIEDRRFYRHGGVDPRGLARAMWTNLKALSVVQGGSTITQQTAKNLFLSPDRSLKRKVQELLLALWLEHKLTKDEILTLYLNRVYLGAGTYGMDAAARKYFGKSAREVTVYEAAMLAGLLKAPARYNPQANANLAAKRTATVLAAMVDAGFLTRTDADAAIKAGPGRRTDVTNRGGRSSRYFADWVAARLDDYIGPLKHDILVTTTLDPALQAVAEKTLVRHLEAQGDAREVHQGAIVVLGPMGDVRAMVGGKSYADSQFNRATMARRQPGSAFKPFIWLAALQQGFEPTDVVEDARITIDGWSPANFDHTYRGPTSLADALARSVNTVSVRLTELVGREEVARTARRMGLSDLHASPSIALGTSEVTLIDLTAAYAPFANGGTVVMPFAITRIATTDGEVLFNRTVSGLGQVMDPLTLGRMNRMLAGVIDHGTGKAANVGRPAGGKTGTSQDYRDAWFVGYTPDMLAGVWVGNDNNAPMVNVTGGGLPARMFAEVMREAHRGIVARPLPGDDEPPDSFGGWLKSLFK